MFSANPSWIVYDHFETEKITLPPLTKSQLSLKLRTIEPQSRLTVSYILKACIPSLIIIIHLKKINSFKTNLVKHLSK